MAKSKIGRNVKKCQRYFNEKRRVKNKTRKLERYIEKAKKRQLQQQVINPNTKQLPKRSTNAVENIIKSSPIGRKREKAGRWA